MSVCKPILIFALTQNGCYMREARKRLNSRKVDKGEGAEKKRFLVE